MSQLAKLGVQPGSAFLISISIECSGKLHGTSERYILDVIIVVTINCYWKQVLSHP